MDPWPRGWDVWPRMVRPCFRSGRWLEVTKLAPPADFTPKSQWCLPRWRVSVPQ